MERTLLCLLLSSIRCTSRPFPKLLYPMFFHKILPSEIVLWFSVKISSWRCQRRHPCLTLTHVFHSKRLMRNQILNNDFMLIWPTTNFYLCWCIDRKGSSLHHWKIIDSFQEWIVSAWRMWFMLYSMLNQCRWLQLRAKNTSLTSNWLNFIDFQYSVSSDQTSLWELTRVVCSSKSKESCTYITISSRFHLVIANETLWIFLKAIAPRICWLFLYWVISKFCYWFQFTCFPLWSPIDQIFKLKKEPTLLRNITACHDSSWPIAMTSEWHYISYWILFNYSCSTSSSSRICLIPWTKIVILHVVFNIGVCKSSLTVSVIFLDHAPTVFSCHSCSNFIML
jgi:hypothetical protein